MDVVGLGGRIISLAVGAWHTCALTDTGGVQCWGCNAHGELGDGTTTDRGRPGDVSGLISGVIAIASGYNHTCALTNGGGVKCWGENILGQLGDGWTTNSSVPVNVIGLAGGATAIAAGGFHTCVLTNSGGAKCWGYGGNGQLGDGTTELYRNTPVDVLGLSGILAISGGDAHTCALVNGGLKCWGWNEYGQLGDGSTASSNLAVGVAGLASGVGAISAGGRHTCALLSGGRPSAGDRTATASWA